MGEHTGTTSPATAPEEPLSELEDAILTMSGELNAGTCHWLSLIAEYDRREGWHEWGARSCAHWLNWKCGLGLVAARDHVRVAHALEDLPIVHAHFASGELSYSKVRALTRTATPENEADLVDLALSCPASQVERLLRALRHATQDEEDALLHQRKRTLEWHWDDDGMLAIRGRLPPEIGTLVITALQAANTHATPGTPATDNETGSIAESPPLPEEPEPSLAPDDPHAARDADALAAIAATYLAHHPNTPSTHRYQVMLHLGADHHLPNTGPALSPETIKRLTCDSDTIPVTWATHDTIEHIGRQTRTIPTPTRHALHLRDRGCRFPGCTNRHTIQGHHIKHWAEGGPTTLDNLIQLCHLCRRRHKWHYADRLVMPTGLGLRCDVGDRVPVWSA